MRLRLEQSLSPGKPTFFPRLWIPPAVILGKSATCSSGLVGGPKVLLTEIARHLTVIFYIVEVGRGRLAGIAFLQASDLLILTI